MQLKTVIKRGGYEQPFDVAKIKKVIVWATQGTGLNPLELEQVIDGEFRDTETSVDIHNKLIIAANGLVDLKDRDTLKWNVVAGRLKLMDLYKESATVRKHSFLDYDPNFEEYVSEMVEAGIYDSRLTEYYTLTELSKAGTFIRQELDMSLTLSQLVTLIGKSLVKYKGKVVELPQERYLLCALMLNLFDKSADRLDYVKRDYKALASRKISLATPMLAGLGRQGANLASCFIQQPEDSLDGIQYNEAVYGRISKNGGASGWSWHKVRAIGSDVSGYKNASGGLLPWTKILNDKCIAVNQTGKRKGAITPAVPIYHRDIWDFLEVQEEAGDVRNKAYDISPQITIPDYFMKKYENKEDWYVFDPYELKTVLGIELDEVFGTEFERAYDRCVEAYNKGIISNVKIFNTKELMKKIYVQWHSTGFPTISFTDKMNRDNPNKHIGNIPCSNLCVTGDTKILTKNGYLDISKIAGTKQIVWNGYQWSKADIFKTSESSKVIKIELNNGQFIEATEYHKWYILDEKLGYDNYKEVRTNELKIGDKLIRPKLPLIPGNKELNYAYENGFYSGDGSGRTKNTSWIYLYHNKRDLLEHFKDYSNKQIDDNQKRIILTYNTTQLKEKFFVPGCEYSVKSRLDWLSGYLDADGCVVTESKTNAKTLQVVSVNEKFLKEVQLMLQTLGVSSKIQEHREAGKYLLPDGKGGLKEYQCNTTYRMLISSIGFYTLFKLGMKTHRLSEPTRFPNRNAERFVQVTQIIDEDKYAETYCGTEPINHTLMFNGVLTGNCSESFGVVKPSTNFRWEFDYRTNTSTFTHDVGLTHICNLMSINIYNAYDELDDIVPLITRMLDNTIELTEQTNPEAERYNKNLRVIGIGMLGLADIMAKHKISYNKIEQVKAFVNKLFARVAGLAYKTSALLAKDRGQYPYYSGSQFNKGIFLGRKIDDIIAELEEAGNIDEADLWEEVKELNAKYGLRNGSVLSYPPTTTTSLGQGVSAGVTPVYQKAYMDKNMISTSVVVAPEVMTDNVWYYVEQRTLDQAQLMTVVGEMQKWVDQAISFELNWDHENKQVKIQDYDDVMMTAWRSGCKTIYYQRHILPNAQKEIEKEVCAGCAG